MITLNIYYVMNVVILQQWIVNQNKRGLKMKIKKLKKIPIIIFAIVIFILSSFRQKLPLPGEGVPIPDYSFYIYHIGEFGLFSMFLMLGFYPEFKLYFLMGISLLYGIFDEVHQYFVPTRFFDVVDILCNSIGVILGVIFSLVVYRIKNKKKIMERINHG
ncbi:hypothetical protein LCGC14_1036090 [marine sediment metagenome]|uniref:VanZ-like domain-containing protein n=1 Tax=marine sediment metagenome TaxID=412755 RepID=A0A0F9NET7_9ZZZZ